MRLREPEAEQGFQRAAEAVSGGWKSRGGGVQPLHCGWWARWGGPKRLGRDELSPLPLLAPASARGRAGGGGYELSSTL